MCFSSYRGRGKKGEFFFFRLVAIDLISSDRKWQVIIYAFAFVKCVRLEIGNKKRKEK